MEGCGIQPKHAGTRWHGNEGSPGEIAVKGYDHPSVPESEDSHAGVRHADTPKLTKGEHIQVVLPFEISRDFRREILVE